MAASGPAAAAVVEPFPIFKLAHRFLLYDVDTVTHVRKEYNITGVLAGTLPQAPQQNVFLGLPLELMPEEARLLVEKGVAYIADDNSEHKRNFLKNGLSVEERRAFQSALRKQGQNAALEATKKSDEKKQAGLKKQSKTQGATENWNDIPEDMFAPGPRRVKPKKSPRPSAIDLRAAAAATAAHSGPPTANGLQQPAAQDDEDDLLFASSSNSFPTSSVRSPTLSVASESTTTRISDLEPYHITPTSTYPPLIHKRSSLPSSENSSSASHRISEESTLAALPSYAFYKHLHSQNYFLMPGLRFGCQYTAYPGDPLRFHAHFLCNAKQWDEEFDLADLVGGGRLGTGVKKGFLVGGEEQTSDETSTKRVRAFGLEWAGM